MKDLTAMFVAAGCDDVRSYIQSGNIIFSAAPRVSAKVAALVTAEISKRFGYQTPVVVRTAKQIEDVILNNPFLKEGAAEETLHVLFLDGLPDPRRPGP